MPGLRPDEWTQILRMAEDTAENVYGMSVEDNLHGRNHWLAVAQTGSALARAEGKDPRIAEAFGLIHDACRDTDDEDREHGLRAAALVKATPLFRQILGTEGARALELACDLHSTPDRHHDPQVGVCLDADRLTIGRTKPAVKEQYLSTRAASRFLRGHGPLLTAGAPSVFRALSAALPGQVRHHPSQPRTGMVYAAMDTAPAGPHGKPHSLMISCQCLADLSDPMTLVGQPLFDELGAIDREMQLTSDSGKPVSLFDCLKTGRMELLGGNEDQANFISRVMKLGHDAVLFLDYANISTAVLALSPQAHIQSFATQIEEGWSPPARPAPPGKSRPAARLPASALDTPSRREGR
jgi:hypothetical protein